MAVQSTTETALRDLCVSTIQGIVPAIQPQKRWRLRQGNRRGTVGTRDRAFSVELEEYTEAPEYSAGWTTGSMVSEVILVVRADYSLRHDETVAVIPSDHRQIRDALHQLRKNGVNGIWHCESAGASNLPAEQPDQFQAEHRFMLRYQHAREY